MFKEGQGECTAHLVRLSVKTQLSAGMGAQVPVLIFLILFLFKCRFGCLSTGLGSSVPISGSEVPVLGS